ncbi:uncharacterized protein PSFLO_07017 [Pseudozyma flocculosa]|uniref:Uncharacterized protein n=1 Tax=Pseudozyma flocculosa TaxID=84751 RepID=A0A5C3FCX5_9BASI|nr:uncharacterized protein PSFLO_07017 [Pseudozyma flocculosa]
MPTMVQRDEGSMRHYLMLASFRQAAGERAGGQGGRCSCWGVRDAERARRMNLVFVEHGLAWSGQTAHQGLMVADRRASSSPDSEAADMYMYGRRYGKFDDSHRGIMLMGRGVVGPPRIDGRGAVGRVAGWLPVAACSTAKCRRRRVDLAACPARPPPILASGDTVRGQDRRSPPAPSPT